MFVPLRRRPTRSTNVNSFHRLIAISNFAGRFVTFPSSTGRVYGLHYTTNLLFPGWSPLITNVPGLPGTTTIPDTNAAPVRLYRIGVGFPP